MNTVDMSWITIPIDTWNQNYSSLFVDVGNDLLWTFATVIFVIYAFKHGLTGGLLHFMIQFFPMVLVAASFLRYYDHPLPFTDSSFHQIFSDFAQSIANQMDISRMDEMFRKISQLLMGLEKPSASNIVMIPIYFMVEVDCWVIEALLFLLTGIGFIALGIGSLLGPLFIPCMIWPRMSHLFWNWVGYMLQYSFYRVVAAAMTYYISSFVISFLDQTVHGQFSLAQWVSIAPQAAVVVALVAVSVFRTDRFVGDLFHGTSGGGHPLIPRMQSLRF